jgi:hypothetical protein
MTTTKPRHCQMVRGVNKVKRIQFCQEQITDNDGLENAIFSDECNVQLHQHKTTSYILKTAAPPTFPLKIHVWAGISKRGPTNIILFDSTMCRFFFTCEILGNALLPLIHRLYPASYRFQQDNDPKHKSKLATDFMRENGGLAEWKPRFKSHRDGMESTKIVQQQNGVKNERRVDKLYHPFLGHVHDCRAMQEIYWPHIQSCTSVCFNGWTCDMPNRIFTENSLGKSFEHFAEILNSDDAVKERARKLLSVDAYGKWKLSKCWWNNCYMYLCLYIHSILFTCWLTEWLQCLENLFFCQYSRTI